MNAGRHEITFNAKNLSSGMYFYRIKAGNFVKTMKMILMK
ncbi:MAG: T9SS type A sorting domain-containing protein [Ignavibacteria bacterium]